MHTSQKAASVLQESTTTMQQAYKQSEQFTTYTDKAKDALKEFWKSLSKEDKLYYGSISVFCVVVFIIWIRRFPIRTALKVMWGLLVSMVQGIGGIIRGNKGGKKDMGMDVIVKNVEGEMVKNIEGIMEGEEER